MNSTTEARHGWNRLLRILLPAALAAGVATAAEPCPEVAHDETIRTVAEQPASSLDDSLPAESLQRWLQSVLGADAVVCWERNDCGEQAGDPAVDRGRDLPLCVEAWSLLGDDTTVAVVLSVGTVSHPETKAVGVRDIVVRGPSGTHRRLARLAELRGIGRR